MTYHYRAFKRRARGPSIGLPERTCAFDADYEDTARFAAYVRVAELPPGCFAVLYDESGHQIWTGESRPEPREA